MTDPKEKTKPGVPTRTPQKKTSSGMFDNLRPLPHPIEEILGFSTQTQPDPTQPITSQPSPARPNPTRPSPAQPQSPQPPAAVAPVRDFNKRANSIDRDAMPKGRFPGTSYKLYNALYQRTRGAVVPVRTIQATKRELMEWSNIRSKNTIAVNLQILVANGWIQKSLEIGDHEGSIYEVFLPEEVNSTQPIPSQPDPSHPNPARKLGLDPTQQSGWDGMGKVLENKSTSGKPKTSFKTNTEKTDDDEAFAALFAVERELTGKTSSSERWRELAELLAAELKIAAGRTTVSSIPAFLAEHLRRRLWKKEKRQIEAEAAEQKGSSPTAKVDASKCPDCFGTGMHYPEGYDKGVAKCPHSKLTTEGTG